MENYTYEFYSPIEYNNPHVHLEYDYNNYSGLNTAEIKALQLEEYKNKNEEIKKLKNKEYFKKYNKNILIHQEEEKMKNKEEEYLKKIEKEEKLLKNQNFNKAVYEKNMRPFSTRHVKSKTATKNIKRNKNNNKLIKVVNHMNEHINNSDVEMEYGNEHFIPKKRILKETSNYIQMDDNNENKINTLYQNFNFNSNEGNNIENIDTNLNLKKNNEDINTNMDNNIIDLRGNIEEQLMQEIKNKNKYKNKCEMNEQINDKMSNIKRFRINGILPAQNNIVEKKKKKKENKNKKFFSEFERRRFIKALKNIFTERLGEHNIYIQNICNCGNLQNQLTALVEKGNLTVYALTEVECANNCVFYKNKKAYLKAINDVLNSIKDIAYENFHNKYKDKI